MLGYNTYCFCLIFVCYCVGVLGAKQNNSLNNTNINEVNNSLSLNKTNVENNLNHKEIDWSFVDSLRKYVSENVSEASTTEPALNDSLRFTIMCETPNHESAYCVGIKSCKVLMEVLFKDTSRKFLVESKCANNRGDLSNPMVCCGTWGHYKNMNKGMFPKKCGHQKVNNIDIADRIFGGREALPAEYPWMARLKHKNSYGYKTYGCSGFLIAAKYVLTAAHCIQTENVNITGPVESVLLGAHDTKKDNRCVKGKHCIITEHQEIRVQDILVHEKYSKDDRNHYNDIALLHLANGAQQTKFVRFICLPEKRIDTKLYSICGWGKTEKAEYSSKKLKVDLIAMSKEKCMDKFQEINITISDTQICAGGEYMIDSCTGDSGGPLMTGITSANSTIWYASGIVSFGMGCGNEGWPGVYTNIPKFLPWIKEKMLHFATADSSRRPRN